MVWAARELAQEYVQVSAAKLQLVGYVGWMGRYAPVTQMCAGVKVWHGVVVENRALLSEFELLL